MDDDRPIFLQVAEQLEEHIIGGVMAEESQVPSINELAAFHRINPATALRGINRLVDAGVLYKKRGIGMFVSAGARDLLLAQRRLNFQVDFVRPLLAESNRLGLSTDDLVELIRKEARP